jgi:hypothetical protein
MPCGALLFGLKWVYNVSRVYLSIMYQCFSRRPETCAVELTCDPASIWSTRDHIWYSSYQRHMMMFIFTFPFILTFSFLPVSVGHGR